MTKKSKHYQIEVIRPTLTIKAKRGRIRKKALRELLEAKDYEIYKAMRFIFKHQPKLAEAYKGYEISWYFPESVAIALIKHICPGYDIKIILHKKK